MKPYLLCLALFSACAAGLVGCNSPLLEHANAGEPAQPGTGPGTGASSKQGACPLSFPAEGLCAELTWEGAVNDQDPASFTLRFWKSAEGTSAGPYVDPGYAVGAKLWMPAMGHGSSPVTVVPAPDASGASIPGVYNGSSAYFIMPGDWEVHVQLKQGTAVHEEAILTIHI